MRACRVTKSPVQRASGIAAPAAPEAHVCAVKLRRAEKYLAEAPQCPSASVEPSSAPRLHAAQTLSIFVLLMMSAVRVVEVHQLLEQLVRARIVETHHEGARARAALDRADARDRAPDAGSNAATNCCL